MRFKLEQAQLERMEGIEDIREMHDRLIVAEALVYQAPIISKDDILRQSRTVQAIWFPGSVDRAD